MEFLKEIFEIFCTNYFWTWYLYLIPIAFFVMMTTCFIQHNKDNKNRKNKTVFDDGLIGLGIVLSAVPIINILTCMTGISLLLYELYEKREWLAEYIYILPVLTVLLVFLL